MLQIWLPNQYSELYVWHDKTSDWQAYDNWQAIFDSFGKASVCLYFPSRHSLQLQTDLSASALKQLGNTGKQYLFEEMSLSDVEKLEIRDLANTNHHYLYATAKNDIEQWIQSALLANIDVQVLLPDFLLLATPESGVSEAVFYHDKNTSLLRQSDINGIAVSFLPLLLERLPLVDEIKLMQPIQPKQSNTTDKTDNKEQTDKPNDILTQVSTELTQLKLLHTVSQETPTPIQKPLRHPLNFIIKAKSNRYLSPYFKVSLIVMAFALTTQIVGDALSAYQYKQSVKVAQRSLSKQLKTWFPEMRVNSRTSIQRQVEPMLITATETEQSSMEVFSRVSPLIRQSQLSVKELFIDKQSLKIKLQARNRAELDRFVGLLQQQGMPSAQLGSISNANTNINGSTNQNTNQLSNDVIGDIIITTQSPAQ